MMNNIPGDRAVTTFYGKINELLEPEERSVADCYAIFGGPLWIIKSKYYGDYMYNVLVFSTVGSWERDFFENDFRWPDDLGIHDLARKCHNLARDLCDICIIFGYKQRGGEYITCQPGGPLLQAFTGILTPEQIASYSDPSDEPTYDADDGASDDDYGPPEYD